MKVIVIFFLFLLLNFLLLYVYNILVREFEKVQVICKMYLLPLNDATVIRNERVFAEMSYSLQHEITRRYNLHAFIKLDDGRRPFISSALKIYVRVILDEEKKKIV